MQVFKQESGKNRKKRFGCYNLATPLEFSSGSHQKVDRVFKVGEDIGQRDNIQTLITKGIELVNVMTVKDMIEIIKFQDITGNDIAIEPFQWGDTAPNLQDGQMFRMGETTKLAAIELPIPVQ